MSWFILAVAAVFEIGWAVGLKYSEGFTRPWVSVATVVATIVSMGLLGVAMRSLPVGTAYAVWVGIGMVGTAVFGIGLWDEPAGFARLMSLSLIIVGVIGLRLTASG